MEPSVIKVAVIGAGAAGLAAVRLLACDDENYPAQYIRENDGNDNCCDVDGENGNYFCSSPSPTRFDVTVFERDDDIGGTWRYTDDVGTKKNGLPVHASMYKNLRTFLPKEILRFPDFAFPAHLPSFPSHRDVLTYLHDYATHFDLRKHIQFETTVEKVKPVPDYRNRFGTKWEVTTSRVKDRQNVKTQMFDAVLVCNGQFSVPRIPAIPGLDGTSSAHVIHSHDYRVPDAYKDKTVAVLGGLLSGQEISLEVASVAHKVYLCHDHPRLVTPFPCNLEQKPAIVKIIHRANSNNSNSDDADDDFTTTTTTTTTTTDNNINNNNNVQSLVEFRNGEISPVDAIILCTGYRHRFTFLDDSIGLNVDDGRVTPLYRHFLCTSFPSLAIVSTIQYVAFFHLFYMQIKCFRSLLTGQGRLPSRKEMLEDEAREYHEKLREGLPHRYAHFLLGDRQFRYYDGLADLGNFPRLPKSVQTIFEANTRIRNKDFTTYRNYKYVINEDDSVHVIKTADK